MSIATQAARALAKRSIAARRRKWGAKGFRKRMRAWGKLGGRPKGTGKKQLAKQKVAKRGGK